jgi:hypothetical protein
MLPEMIEIDAYSPRRITERMERAGLVRRVRST